MQAESEPMKGSERISVKVSSDFKERLETVAESNDLTISEMARRGLDSEMNKLQGGRA